MSAITKTKIVYPPKGLSASKRAAAAQNLKQVLAAHGIAASIVPNYGVKVPYDLDMATYLSTGSPVTAMPPAPVQTKPLALRHPVMPSLGGIDPAYSGENPSYAPGYFDAGRVDGFDGTFISREWRRIPRAVSRWLIPLSYLQQHAGGEFTVAVGDSAYGSFEVWDYSTNPPSIAKRPKSWGGGNAVMDIVHSGSVAIAVPANPTADMGLAIFLTGYHGSETVGLQG